MKEIGLVFSSPFQDKSLSKTSESRIVIRRATRLGSKPLELLLSERLEFKDKRYRSEVSPRDPSLRAMFFPQKSIFSYLLKGCRGIIRHIVS
jgi:hypothetical protein